MKKKEQGEKSRKTYMVNKLMRESAVVLEEIVILCAAGDDYFLRDGLYLAPAKGERSAQIPIIRCMT